MGILHTTRTAILSRLHYIAAFILLLVLAFSSHFVFGAPATVDVEAKNYVFEAKVITIKAGDTVRWTNHDAVPHTVTASDQSWTSPDFNADQQFSRTFTTPGTYAYYCKYHGTPAGGFMAGTIIVQPQAPAPTPTTQPAPTSKPAPTPGQATQTKVFLPMLSIPAPAQQKSVDVIDFSFAPKTLTLKVGDSVKWTNKGEYPHSVTAGDNSWDSGLLDLGRSFTKTFDKPGTFAYYCKYHGTAKGAGMAATVIVQAEDPTAQPNPPSAPGVPTAAPAPTSAPSAPTAAPAPAPGTNAVAVVDFAFTPKNLIIKVGDTVRWSNQGQFAHTITASDNTWGSPDMAGGAAFSKTFTAPGTYAYYCKYHGGASGTGMAGTIVVQQAGATPPPAPTNAPAPTSPPPPPPAPAGTSAVNVIDFAFTPKNLIVKVGDTVRWSNQGQFAHTVSAANNAWSSPDMTAGATFSKTFTTPGTYAYYCKYHGGASGTGMAGTIIVQQPGATPPPTPTNVPAPTSPPPPPPPPAGTSAVNAIDFSFTPKTLTISPGATVRFTNIGSAAHTFTASNNTWDSGKLNTGASFSKTFLTAGTYTYYCQFHGSANGTGMAGTIIVQQPGGPAIPTPTPAPSATPVPPPPPPPAGTSSVNVIDFSYTPKTLTINAGASVRFTNIGSSDHTVSASNGSFNSGRLGSGASFTQTFATPGTYTYYCQFHGSANGTGMAGTIIVQGATAPGATPVPSPTPAPAPAPVGQPIKATLTGGPNWPAATGFVQFENKGTSQLFYLELKAGQSYQASGVDIFVDGVKVAVAQVTSAGECKLELRTDNGQAVPAINVGSKVVMKLPGGGLLASGTF